MLALLTTGSLTVRDIFKPESMALNLSERDSTASITLGPDGPELALGDWLQDLTEPGKGIVWRVRNIDKQHDTGTRNITLEHLIYSLADRILPTEVTPETMGGSADGVSARTAATYILNQQEVWRLGDFDFSVSNPYKFDGETLKAALETINGTLDGSIWEYDFSAYPFMLHVRQLSTDAGSEMRAGRNISTLKYSVDRSRMYTRFYPVGKDNLRLSGGGYVSKNEQLYGRIDKTETDQSKGTEAELTAWANERLLRHAQPNITVTISGLDLSEATGESLDQLKIGKRCRVPLPEEGTLISEKVTKLSWRDKVKDPESVTVTLANALEDVQSIIRQEQAKSGGSGRSAAKANEEKVILIGEVEEGLYSAISQTSTNIYIQVANAKSDLYSAIELTASSISASVSSAKSDLYSSIMMTSTSIYVQVANAKSDLYSSIEITASSINASVASAKSSLYSTIMITSTNIYTQVGNAKSGLYSSIEQTASSIRTEVSKARSKIWSSIEQNAESITTKVSKDGVISSINQTAETITIQASKINLSGYVTADSLATTNGRIDNLTNGTTMAEYIRTNQFMVESNYFTMGSNSIRLRTATISGVTINYLGTASS